MKTPHHFFLLPRAEARQRWMSYAAMKSDVFLTDDVVLYLSDTLKWVKSWNPARREEFTGLCYTGPTVFSERGAFHLSELLQLWSRIFALGPEQLTLREGLMLDDNGESELKRFGAARDEVVHQLKTIAVWGRLAAGGDHDILTTGI